MKFAIRNITSLSSLISNLRKDLNNYKGPVWYRGHYNREWKLLPSLLREKKSLDEKNLIKKFKQNATMLINPRPDNWFDWLFIMQHYGVSTRLLDWTESPLIATYFALNDENQNKNADGRLWILLPVELNKLSNILPDYSYDIPSFEDEILNNYEPETLASETTSKLFPIATIAPRNSTRMQAQMSVFTISHKDQTPIEQLGDKNHIWCYNIPQSSKQTIMSELKILGITKFQLFPELSSIGHIL